MTCNVQRFCTNRSCVSSHISNALFELIFAEIWTTYATFYDIITNYKEKMISSNMVLSHLTHSFLPNLSCSAEMFFQSLSLRPIWNVPGKWLTFWKSRTALKHSAFMCLPQVPTQLGVSVAEGRYPENKVLAGQPCTKHNTRRNFLTAPPLPRGKQQKAEPRLMPEGEANYKGKQTKPKTIEQYGAKSSQTSVIPGEGGTLPKRRLATNYAIDSCSSSECKTLAVSHLTKLDTNKCRVNPNVH